MTDLNNQFWKHTTATTTIDVVVDDDLSIQDSYITNFVSDKRVYVYEKEADRFIEQNDEGARDKYDKYKPGTKINIGGIEMAVVGVLPTNERLTRKQKEDVISYLRANGGSCTAYTETQTNANEAATAADCCCQPGQGLSSTDIPYEPAPPYNPELPVQPCGWIDASRYCGCSARRTIVTNCNGVTGEREEFVPLIEGFEHIGNDNYPDGYNGPGGVTPLITCRTTISTRSYQRSEIDFLTGQRCDYFISETLFCEFVAVITLTRGCDNRQAPFAIDPSEMTPITGGGASGQLVADGNGLVEADILNDANAAVGCNLAECLSELVTLPVKLMGAVAVKTNCGCMKAVNAGGDYGVDDYLCEQGVCDWIRGMLRDLGINFPFECPNTWATDANRRGQAWINLIQMLTIIFTLQGVGGDDIFGSLLASDSDGNTNTGRTSTGSQCGVWNKLTKEFFDKWIKPLENEDCPADADGGTAKDNLPKRPSPECVACLDRLCALTSLPARNRIAQMYGQASACIFNFNQSRPNASDEERRTAFAQCMKTACENEYGPGGPPAEGCPGGRLSCDQIFAIHAYGQTPPCKTVNTTEPINPATLPNPNTSDAS